MIFFFAHSKDVSTSLRNISIILFLCSFSTLISFSLAPARAENRSLPQRPSWEPTPVDDTDRSLRWTAVQHFGQFPPQFIPVPAYFSPQELAAKPRVEGPYTSRGIFGFGGGVRAGVYTGDPTNALFTTRLGYKLDSNFALSLRPSLIFSDSYYNNNGNNNRNNDFFNNNEFRLPLTLDLFYNSFISPFIGGGLATNADGLGYTDGMLTGGVDLNITKNLALGFDVNYIYQTNINDTDWEALGMLYLRF